VICR